VRPRSGAAVASPTWETYLGTVWGTMAALRRMLPRTSAPAGPCGGS